MIIQKEFSDKQANVIISALNEFEEFQLPQSVSRLLLYQLVKRIGDDFEFPREDGQMPTRPEHFSGKKRKLMLSLDEADYIARALSASSNSNTAMAYTFPEHSMLYKQRAHCEEELLLELEALLAKNDYGVWHELSINDDAWESVFGEIKDTPTQSLKSND